MMRTSYDKKLKIVLFLFVLVTFCFITFNINNISQPSFSEYLGEKGFLVNRSNWVSIFECPLPEVDPWEPQDADFFGVPTKEEKCYPPKNDISKLENGVLWIFLTDSNWKCQYRCLNYKNDSTGSLGPWINYQSPGPAFVECDWVEVLCISEGFFKNTQYHQVHSQIYSPKNNGTKKSRYNIYILGLDGVSHGEFHRTMPKTAYFLQNIMQGISFRHLSKVGQNSVPNQMSSLFGQRFVSLPHEPSGYPCYNMSNSYNCKQFHSKEAQYIGFIYNDKGYRTAHIDDMLPLVQAYPNCKGFGFAHTNHSTVPLSRQMYNDQEFRNAAVSKHCGEGFKVSIDFFKSFVKAKTAESKFGYTMITEPSHDSIKYPYRYDDYFYEQLKSIETDLDDSFLFVWSDHGHHFGDYYYTDRGQTDTRNPMMTIILPKALRENPAHPLVQNLRKNTQTLVSQYDIFPTLVDLATANFNDPASFSTHVTLKDLQKLNKRIHEVHGDSLLRPLTHRTPTCAGLGIPFTFCLCRWPLFTPPDEAHLKLFVIKEIPVLMNNYIKSIGAEDVCEVIEVKTNSDIEVREVAAKLASKSSRMFRTRFSITKFQDTNPYNFEVFFELTSKGTASLAGRIYRYDVKWADAECLVNEYDRHFCYCKS